MGTMKISSASQLASALKSAPSGTTFELTSGSYSLSSRGGDFHGAVVKAAAGANVTFTDIELRDVSHLTFDGINFQQRSGDGKGIVIATSNDITIRDATIHGTGKDVGVWINQSEQISLENNHVSGYTTGYWLGSISNLSVRNNTINDISTDAMIVGGIKTGTLSGNHIDLDTGGGQKHTDGMQFYNTGSTSPLTNVTVSNNVINTHNGESHGIYMANHKADIGGGSSTFFKSLVIEHNTVVSGQVSGIAVGQTNGLIIRDNTILQDTHYRSTKEIDIPVIRVHEASTGVSITGNTTHKLPEASGRNWFPTDKAEPTWNISGNKIVPLGTTTRASAPEAASAAEATAAAAPAQALSSAAFPASDHDAHTFRLDAAGGNDVLRGFSFDDGDRIVLRDFAKGTFHAEAGGNPLDVSDNGSRVVIDHIDDLRELVAASSDVHASQGNGDTLVLDIDQPGADHLVKFLDMAHAYL